MNTPITDDVIRCPICGTPIDAPRMTIEEQEIVYCPDGYDLCGDGSVGAQLIPRSGETEGGYIAGRTHFSLEPCGCPVTSIQRRADGTWLVRGVNHAMQPVEVVGRFRFPR